MKKAWILVIPVFLATSVFSNADASWLSKQLDKLAKATSTTTATSNGEMSLPAQSERWVKISENQYYATYGDSRTLKASGEAQNRQVEGFFKRVYTPIGSQRLGETSDGEVKPDVITHSIYYTTYTTTYRGFIKQGPKYYDVHNNLIYEGLLADMPRYGHIMTEKYTPDSEDEQIKDKLFRAFGWNY